MCSDNIDSYPSFAFLFPPPLPASMQQSQPILTSPFFLSDSSFCFLSPPPPPIPSHPIDALPARPVQVTNQNNWLLEEFPYFSLIFNFLNRFSKIVESRFTPRVSNTIDSKTVSNNLIFTSFSSPISYRSLNDPRRFFSSSSSSSFIIFLDKINLVPSRLILFSPSFLFCSFRTKKKKGGEKKNQ